MLSTLCWVPRGASGPPRQQELTQAEIDMLVEKQGDLSLEDAEAEADVAEPEEEEDMDDAELDVDEKESKQEEPTADDSDDMEVDPETAAAKEEKLLSSLNMDAYDEEESGATVFLSGNKLAVYGDNVEDPYITVPDDDDVSDEEDMHISNNDGVIVVGRTEEEQSRLEVYVYDEQSGSLYVHHDIMLPAFPLSLAWMDYGGPRPRLPTEDEEETESKADPLAKGNFVAVGTFNPQIEIWDLDVMDVVEPISVLGGRDEGTRATTNPLQGSSKKNKKKKKKKAGALKDALLGQLRPGSHNDAVMALSWHPMERFRLASGSADSTIKLWDVQTSTCANTFQIHKNTKVQALKWNPAEANILLSGAYDKTACMTDIRKPDAVARYKVDSDIEALAWNPHNPALFMASTESGTVTCHDARKPNGGAVFTIGAHDKAVTAMSFSSKLPILATASLDKQVKLWSLADGEPKCIMSKQMKVGPLYCLGFDTHSPYLLSAGGGKGILSVWDISTEECIQAMTK